LDVEARIARLQLGEQFIVGSEQAHVHVDAAGLLEVGQGGVTNVGVPVVEIQLRLFRTAGGGRAWLRAGGERDSDRCGAQGGEQAPAGRAASRKHRHRVVLPKG